MVDIKSHHDSDSDKDMCGIILTNLPINLSSQQLDTFLGLTDELNIICSRKMAVDNVGKYAIVISPRYHTRYILNHNNHKLQNNIITVKMTQLEFYEIQLHTTNDNPQYVANEKDVIEFMFTNSIGHMVETRCDIISSEVSTIESGDSTQTKIPNCTCIDRNNNADSWR